MDGTQHNGVDRGFERGNIMNKETTKKVIEYVKWMQIQYNDAIIDYEDLRWWKV